MPRELAEIECGSRDIDIVACYLRIPGRGHERLAAKLDIKRGADINSVAGERIEPDPVVVAEIPGLGADEDGRHNTVGRSSGNTAGRFLLPTGTDVIGILRCFRLVEQIAREIKPVLDHLEISIDLQLQSKIFYTCATRLVYAMPLRLRRKRDRKRRRRAPLQQHVPYFAEEAAEREMIAILQIRHVVDDVCGN